MLHSYPGLYLFHAMEQPILPHVFTIKFCLLPITKAAPGDCIQRVPSFYSIDSEEGATEFWCDVFHGFPLASRRCFEHFHID